MLGKIERLEKNVAALTDSNIEIREIKKSQN